MDVHKEKIVRVADGGKLPGNPHPRTVEAWCKQGVRHCKTKQPIKLESEYIGGTLYTSIEAFDRWRAKLNEGRET